MRGLLNIALLALLPLTAVAQSHGAPSRIARARASMVRSGPALHPFMGRPYTPNPRGGGLPVRPSVPVVIPQPAFHGHAGFHGGQAVFGHGFGAYPFGVPPQNRCFSDAFFDPYYCTRRPVGGRGFGAFGAFGAYPYYGMPVVWDNSSEDYADQAAQQMAQQNAQASAQASDLTAQIQQLREELRQLREQQSAPPAAAAPVAPVAPERQAPPMPTTLVFRDGHRSQVENYAIVGNTLWVFHDQRRQKIPIADLDLQATQQVNLDQGVDFTVPSAR